MELPDFLGFAPLNSARSLMGAEQLGHFEFFDPRLHLTADERTTLADPGLNLGWAQLRCLHDYTLTYKNSRVLVILEREQLEPTYHLAFCRVLQGRNRSEPGQHFWVGTCLPENQVLQVCGECLQQLQFKGYDGARTRHRDYSERVRAGFELSAFLQRYPVYPVKTAELCEAVPVSEVSARAAHPPAPTSQRL
ncbi:hypothetical protein [Marinimicrobium alkaliphilum]|uniref:hypothetical protein n=1 Tax=Marinimicrobium alkaliphilum TaxID=2202654 RepID=UPI000DB94E13|nr:hypothetical protein [Marinimicrobium alkaliphilum]